MKKKRVIPLVLFRDGHVVQSRGFSAYRALGNLGPTLKRFSDWNADEVVLVDISSDQTSHLRTDTRNRPSPSFLEALEDYSKIGTMPMTVGGRVASVRMAGELFGRGADKVLLSSAIHEHPHVVGEIAAEYGSQAVVACLDYSRQAESKEARVLLDRRTGLLGPPLAKSIEKLLNDGNVGEIMLNSVDLDGSKQGMDKLLLESLSWHEVTKPIIVCGGAGNPEDFLEPLSSPQVDAVAAANMFQHIEDSVPLVRNFLLERKALVRRVF